MRTQKLIADILEIALIAFCIFVAVQIVIKIFGGSWGMEQLAIALLISNIGISFKLSRDQTKTNTELKHLRAQFNSLAHDFKITSEDVKELKHNVKELNHNVKELKHDMKGLRNDFNLHLKEHNSPSKST